MSCDLASPERINDMVTFDKTRLRENLSALFQDFELGDSIQILDTYIYIELWIGDRTRKIRFPYTENDYYENELELQNAILLYILGRIDLEIL